MISKLLSKVKCRLIIADRTGAGWQPENPLAEIASIGADLTSNEAWSRVLNDVDVVFHLAGLEYNRATFDWQADLASNFLAVARMLDVCTGVATPPRIVFASSLNVFGEAVGSFIDESTRETPTSLWSVHKLMAEKYLRVRALSGQIQATSLRLANVYGPTANPSANRRVVLNRVICDALNGHPLVLYSNRNLERDFIHVMDAGNAFLAAGCSYERKMLDGSHFHVASGRALSFGEAWGIVAREIEAVTGRRVQVTENDSVRIEPLDSRSFRVGVSAMAEVTGWRPKIAPDRGIRMSVEYFADDKNMAYQ